MMSEDFANTYLAELSERYEVKAPDLGFVPGGPAYLAGNLILLGSAFKDWWKKDLEKAELVLKYSIAHEFRHYLTFAKHIPLLPVKRRMPWQKRLRKAHSELEARKFAWMETGVTHWWALRAWNDFVEEEGL